MDAADRLSDAPEHPRDPTVAFKTADSYEAALSVWKTPEDVSAWIAGNFAYDMARAMRLSAAGSASTPSMSPAITWAVRR